MDRFYKVSYESLPTVALSVTVHLHTVPMTNPIQKTTFTPLRAWSWKCVGLSNCQTYISELIF